MAGLSRSLALSQALIESRRSGDEVYFLQLKLRREGTSVAYATVYRHTGKPIPYDYYAAGLCKADFAPAAVQGSGR